VNLKILHTEWSDGMGGQELRILQDLTALADLGHETALLAVPGSRIGPAARALGIRVIEQPMRGPLHLGAFRNILGLLRREKFHVVNTHSSVDSWLASAAAKMAGTPVLVRTRHLSVPVATHPFNVVYRWPDGIVTTAEMIRERLVRVNRLPADRVISIPTGVDLSVFRPDLDPGPIRDELGLKPGRRVAAMVAVLRTWKRHDLFLEAAARIADRFPDVDFLLVGEGPNRANVEAAVDRFGLAGRAILTGHRKDVERVLAISDVCCLTSDSSEGVPQSVLQYQAMGRPVVGTRVGGMPEVIEHERTGLLCPPKDAEALAQAVTRLLDDPALARTLGENARAQAVRCHGVDTMARNTQAFYRRIMDAKGIG
jgi:glycosyltransferase involved in cell wall biosynthesis